MATIQEQDPLIVSAPMFMVSGAELACAVSKGGGLGFIGGGYRLGDPSNPLLTTLDSELVRSRELLFSETDTANVQDPPVLPIGVGIITLSTDTDPGAAVITMTTPSETGGKATVTPGPLGAVLARHRPAVVWVFGTNNYQNQQQELAVIRGLRTLANHVNAGHGSTLPSSSTKSQDQSFIQPRWPLRIAAQTPSTSVAAAVSAARAGADIIVVQGADAGGHQAAAGAGILAGVPEVVDGLVESGLRGNGDKESNGVEVWAAGGVMDGRGVAAALALGTDAVVMGTRFIATKESNAPPAVRKHLMKVDNGGLTTQKSSLHDHIMGRGQLWTSTHDGRALVTANYAALVAGKKKMEEAVARQIEVAAAVKEGKGPEKEVEDMTVFAGTGVGLVHSVPSATELTATVRTQARDVLRQTASRYASCL